MKIALLNITFLICSQMFCQVKDSIREISFSINEEEININRLSEQDTIYLFFNHKKHQVFGVSLKRKEKPLAYNYIYYLKKESILDSYNNLIISIRVDSIFNSDRKKATFKLIDKKFIRKNKKHVYTIKEMRKIGAKKFLDKIGYATVYLIDTKIKENCKYNAREVKIYYPPEL
jgi:hypothetical protein